jgi:hypothetical protein
LILLFDGEACASASISRIRIALYAHAIMAQMDSFPAPSLRWRNRRRTRSCLRRLTVRFGKAVRWASTNRTRATPECPGPRPRVG